MSFSSPKLFTFPHPFCKLVPNASVPCMESGLSQQQTHFQNQFSVAFTFSLLRSRGSLIKVPRTNICDFEDSCSCLKLCNERTTIFRVESCLLHKSSFLFLQIYHKIYYTILVGYWLRLFQISFTKFYLLYSISF